MWTRTEPVAEIVVDADISDLICFNIFAGAIEAQGKLGIDPAGARSRGRRRLAPRRSRVGLVYQTGGVGGYAQPRFVA
ncbi:hypothetical protein GCM10022419_106060 [Nonomuraea rosea]|uniref:Uncharacterized protein n=1 Tax=Nonomuraea rosea TaxID=638574 RepID=A0ABP6ZGT5_9ACTN